MCVCMYSNVQAWITTMPKRGSDLRRVWTFVSWTNTSAFIHIHTVYQHLLITKWRIPLRTWQYVKLGHASDLIVRIYFYIWLYSAALRHTQEQNKYVHVEWCAYVRMRRITHNCFKCYLYMRWRMGTQHIRLCVKGHVFYCAGAHVYIYNIYFCVHIYVYLYVCIQLCQLAILVQDCQSPSSNSVSTCIHEVIYFLEYVYNF